MSFSKTNVVSFPKKRKRNRKAQSNDERLRFLCSAEDKYAAENVIAAWLAEYRDNPDWAKASLDLALKPTGLQLTQQPGQPVTISPHQPITHHFPQGLVVPDVELQKSVIINRTAPHPAANMRKLKW
jgi:hypothetical protein